MLAGRPPLSHEPTANAEPRSFGCAVPRRTSAFVHVASPVLRNSKYWPSATSPLSSVRKQHWLTNAAPYGSASALGAPQRPASRRERSAATPNRVTRRSVALPARSSLPKSPGMIRMGGVARRSVDEDRDRRCRHLRARHRPPAPPFPRGHGV